MFSIIFNFIRVSLAFIILLAHSAQGKEVSPTQYEFTGYLMLDHDYYGPFYDKTEDHYQHKSEIRRSKLSLSVKPNQYFKSKLQLKYSRELPKQGNFSLGDTLIRFSTNNKLALQIGKMKQPFGLERQTSSSQLISIERSLATEAFSPGRDFGVQLDHKQKKLNWALGYFIHRDSDDEFSASHFNLFKRQDSDIEMTTGRLTGHFNLAHETKLHLGGSLSKQWLNGTKIQFKEKGEINTSDTIIRSARFYADSQLTTQAEFAWITTQSLFQTEIFSAQLEAIDKKNWHFQGAYLQFSHHLYGHYRYKRGKINSKQQQANSVELVLRQSYLNLRDNGVGSEAAITSLGANLYLKYNSKLMLSISNPWITGDTISNNHSGHSFSFRAQWAF